MVGDKGETTVKNRWFWLALLLSSAFLSTTTAIAQDESGIGGHEGRIFAQFSAAQPGQGVGWLWGASGGGYLQGHVLGFMLRGTVIPSGSSTHIYTALLGPRAALDLPFVRAYVEAGGGMGHTGYYESIGNFSSSWGAAWQADAGVTHAIAPRLDWRILEAAYGHIYAGPGISPVILSTGLTLHLW